MMKRTAALTAALLTTLLLSPARAGDRSGPQRIVSLVPSVTAGLYDLGAESRVAGVTAYCPKGGLPKESVGTLWEPNLEKIAVLAPDLVIVSRENNRKTSVERLRAMDIPVMIVENDTDFESICGNFLILGKTVGREDRAREIVAEARRRVETVRSRVEGRPAVRVFWEIGARPLFTISRTSFVRGFNTWTNSTNVFDDITARYPRISREEVIRRDPDAIVLVAMGDVTKEERSSWMKYGSMKAVRDGRIFVIEDNTVFTPTPLTFARGVEILADLLHPGKDGTRP